MKIIRYTFATIVFLLACPLSWVGAWAAGDLGTVGLSILMPTYGGFYWLLHGLPIVGSGFLHTILSWILGMAGAFVSLGIISWLGRDER